MKKILLQNGCTMNWGSGELVSQDVLIEEGYIRSISTTIPMREEYEVIDVAGKLVSAGLIDMHVHLREPGDIHKETIKTGLQAAATGGFTTVACMPNTRPVADSVETVKMICDRANEIDAARVLPIAAITVRELGEELTDMTLLKKAGVIGFSDDGVGVQSSRVMKEAMKKAKDLGMPIIAHCEDDSLAKGGCVHEGVFSRKFALQGIPSVAESVQVARDILLAEEAGVHYHVCHISTKESVRLVREAKARGQNVTTEVTPHHLLLCEEDIPGLDSLYKMNPPLRSKADQEALIEGVLDGTIDMIATDHAPHTLEEKEVGMERAPFGIVGLETAFPLLYTHLVLRGILSLADLLQRMTVRPAEVFGLPYGRLREGEIADIVVIDLEKEERIDPESFLSKGKNTPFAGWLVKGWPVMTMVNGKMVWKQEELSAANCVEA